MSYSVYVIELDEKVWEDRRMQDRNPNRDCTKCCVYVGYTWHIPEVRFQQHKDGIRAGRFVENDGLHLLPELYEPHNPIDGKENALRKENELAEELRELGYAVWCNLA
jgi:predicted GIY-YIG superfamily endonuclease